MNKYIIALLCLSLITISCINKKTNNEIAELTFEGDTITLAENSLILEQIIVQEAELQDFSAEFRTVGTVRPVAGNFAEIAPPTKAVILPATAVMQEQDNDYVFVEISKGKFVRRKVETEFFKRNQVRIISGVSENENVIINGGIYLQ